MSSYIELMGKDESYIFKEIKRHFKREKSCAECGKKYSNNKMTVDHIVPVVDGADPFDQSNWQVLCLSCHREKSREESKRIISL